MTVSNNSTANRRAPNRPASWLSRLRVSRYDRVTGMLISLLILLGLCVAGMFAVWVTNRLTPNTGDTKPKTWDMGLGKKELPPGLSNDIEPPPPSETEPNEQQPEDTLAAVEAAEATKAAQFIGLPNGIGDKKSLGNRDGGSPLGKPQRWELRFREGNTLDTYARQLDFFKIELGVLQPGNKVLYLSNLSQSRPSTREDSRDKEKRYRFTWTQGSLEEADRALLSRANVEAGSSRIFKFLPADLYQRLCKLEAEYAGDKKVRSTLFGVKSDGGEYRFYVMRQSYY